MSTCRSANADRGPLARNGRQCVVYLPFRSRWQRTAASRSDELTLPTLCCPSARQQLTGCLQSAAAIAHRCSPASPRPELLFGSCAANGRCRAGCYRWRLGSPERQLSRTTKANFRPTRDLRRRGSPVAGFRAERQYNEAADRELLGQSGRWPVRPSRAAIPWLLAVRNHDDLNGRRSRRFLTGKSPGKMA